MSEELYVPNGSRESGYDIPPPPKVDEEGNPKKLEQWKSAFLVGIDMDGNAHLSFEPEAFMADKAFDHTATPNEAWLACTQVTSNLHEISIAQRVIMNMQALGAAMAQQAENEAIARAAMAKNPFKQ